MNKEDIFSILDKNVAKNRSNMVIILVISLVMLLGGVCLFLFLENDNVAVGSVIGGIGLLFTLIAAIMLGSKSFEKKTQHIKEILTSNPQSLVWSYVFKQNNRGALSISVVMNFKDGKIFQVDENAIPNKDTTGFMVALQAINPGMHVGYSEELEYKFKKRTL